MGCEGGGEGIDNGDEFRGGKRGGGGEQGLEVGVVGFDAGFECV